MKDARKPCLLVHPWPAELVGAEVLPGLGSCQVLLLLLAQEVMAADDGDEEVIGEEEEEEPEATEHTVHLPRVTGRPCKRLSDLV